ncbi:N-acetyltransferase [Corallococcus praedator]|uniref:N-acetyltransferase n=1 Tax=Corallococcus praedator TaxID=2316724 RepID=A0ABX9Q631_9BACT|nr:MULTISPECIES: GNAT family N-acetyltransferase [Corallococcus]RKH19868.1 N-acetyltransferase [Corallococcus sp. CA031C]RKH92469.1 N-acetyltransferase [Corallococcus praedator]
MPLALATDAQKAARDAVTHAAWGSPLSVPQYQEREARLRAHPWSREAMSTWLWLGDDGAVLASCETFRTDSFLRGGDGRFAQGDSYAIASVFTEDHLRGQGHATRLMDAVALELERVAPRPHSVVLFSDVGAPLYRRSGYVEVPAWDWHLDASEAPGGRTVDGGLQETDVARALERMRRPQVPFYLWPTASQVDWHLERERIYAELLDRPRPRTCGAVVGASTALWTMMARYGELVVLMLDARDASDAEALLAEARRVAHHAGLKRVVWWEEAATAPLLAGVPGTVRVQRDGSLPMLRPLREGMPPAPEVPFPRALWV